MQANVTKLILKNEPNTDGTHTICLYAWIQGKAVRPSVGIKVKPEDWDDLNQKIKGRSNEVKKLNQIIHKKRADGNAILTDYSLMGVDITPKKFKEELMNPGLRGDFLSYWREELERDYERRMIEHGTYIQHDRTLKKFEEFHGTTLFSQFDRKLLESFDAWHSKRLKEKGYDGVREREKSLKHIHKYLKRAKETFDTDKRIQFKWPFENFKWPRHKSKPVFLTYEEIVKLEYLYDNPEDLFVAMLRYARERNMFDWNVEQYANPSGVDRISRILKLFLCQCYTGVRYVDIPKIHRDNIESGRLIFIPQKTRGSSGKEVRMYVTKQIQKYMPTKQEASISNVNYNKYLKEVAALAGINKNLTTHVGRHSFATFCISRGMSLPVLADLMGVSIDTVMVYVHITNKMRDDEMKRAFHQDGEGFLP